MLKEAIKSDEKSLRPRFALAQFYMRTGKTDLAEREYLEATRIVPDNHVTFMALGDFYAATGKP